LSGFSTIADIIMENCKGGDLETMLEVLVSLGPVVEQGSPLA
jgi:hypothetical protein